MSGQFPAHHRQSAGSTPMMENISGWNHSTSSGVNILSGLAGSAPPLSAQSPSLGSGHTQTVFPSVPSPTVTPSRTSKFPAVSQNGGGGGMNADNVGSISNPLLNLHMYVNQDSSQMMQCSNYSATLPAGLKDLSHQSLGRGQNNPVSLVSSVPGKESRSDIHNGDITSNDVSSSTLTCNGEVTVKNAVAGTRAHSPPMLNVRVGIPSSKSHDLDLKENIVLALCADNRLNCSINNKNSLTSTTQQQPVSSNAMCLLKGKVDKVPNDSKPGENLAMKSDIPKSGSMPLSDSNDGQPSDCEVLPSPGPVKQEVHDVESQMAALFAGIADDGRSGLETKPLADVSSTSQGTPNIAAVLESKSSSLKKGKGKTTNGVPKAADSIFGMSSTESTPRKKRKMKPVKDRSWGDSKSKKLKKSGPGKGKYVKEVCDNGSVSSFSRARGPVVHIEGPKDAPTLISVINAPSRLDDDENEGRKKGTVINRARKTHSSEGKYSSAGLCSSSLISRYEAHSTDPRWVCVFCKKGCHVNGLGDLFGPYLVKQDLDTDHHFDFEMNVDRKTVDKKSKRSGLGQTGVQGLLPIPPLGNEPLQYMVWIHEDCAVWAGGVHLIGSRLVGLQEAVWMAVNTKCCRCNADGAILGCQRHGCAQRAHYQCALDAGWNLDEDLFTSSCHLHSVDIVKL